MPDRLRHRRLFSCFLAIALLSACSAPLTPIAAVETKKPPTPVSTPTQVASPIPERTLVPTEAITPTSAKIEVHKNTTLKENNIITGSEPIFAGKIALTFDDCPQGQQLRDTWKFLKDNQIPATFLPNTFCMLPEDFDVWTEISEKEDLGYHTRMHPRLDINPMSVAELTQDFILFQEQIRKIIGNPNFKIKFSRSPYFSALNTFGKAMKENGVYDVRMTVSPVGLDDQTFINTMALNRNGGILLFHPKRPSDLEWIKSHLVLMKNLNGQPTKFVKLSDLFD